MLRRGDAVRGRQGFLDEVRVLNETGLLQRVGIVKFYYDNKNTYRHS